MTLPSDRSILVVSARAGDILIEACAAAGGTVVAVDRFDDAASAFAMVSATVLVVDGRDDPAAALGVVRALGGAIRAHSGVSLVMLEPGDFAAASAAFDAGAMQLLYGNNNREDIVLAVRGALRLRDRLLAAARGEGETARLSGGDALTGLTNAGEARRRVEALVAMAAGPGPAVIVMQLAIGRFGQLNAAYGSSFADAALREAALRLTGLAKQLTSAGSSYFVSRLAGAEFALVLEAPTSLEQAQLHARTIARGFDLPFVIDGHPIYLGCKIGIAEAAVDSGAPRLGGVESLFRQASVALARARAGPPGAIEVFRATPGDDPLRRMADLEADLRRALEDGELDVLFQPQVDTVSRLITGVEALVRWQHPYLGQLSAETLLGVAASAELATSLGSYIRKQALAIAANWPSSLDRLRLSVNVTAADLMMPSFIDDLSSTLATTRFPVTRLTIELTESDLVHDITNAATVLTAVRDLGIYTALDDFGTGYSSLAYLATLPLDYLKIDKSLINDLSGTSRDRVIVKGVVDMARALGMCVVAEGVETEAQREAAELAGCDWYQGFLCSPPMASERLAGFVAAWAAAA